MCNQKGYETLFADQIYSWSVESMRKFHAFFKKCRHNISAMLLYYNNKIKKLLGLAP